MSPDHAGCTIDTIRIGATNLAPLRLLILSDLRLLRDGLALLLAESGQTAVTVVGATDLSASPRAIAAFEPDAILVDTTGPAGLDLACAGRETLPGVTMISFGLGEAEPAVLACARAGVAGFVAPDASADELVAAVRSAVRGELVCSPRTAGMLLNHLGAMTGDRRAPDDDLRRAMLTHREREVALMLSDGLSNKQIARTLDIQCATVKNHVHSVLSKLRLSRRGEIGAALRHGRLFARGAPASITAQHSAAG